MIQLLKIALNLRKPQHNLMRKKFQGGKGIRFQKDQEDFKVTLSEMILVILVILDLEWISKALEMDLMVITHLINPVPINLDKPQGVTPPPLPAM